jgi:hypothetical protein
MKINNPIRTYTVTVEGEERDVRLALNYYALADFADSIGVDFKDLDSAMRQLSSDKFPALIQAAMKGVNPDVTPQEVHDFVAAIPVTSMPEIMQDLMSSSNTPAGNGGQSHPPKGGKTTA